MKIKHKKFGEFELKEPLIQLDLESYSKELNEEGVDLAKSDLFTFSGACVRAAVKTKLIIPKFDVGKSGVGKVRWVWSQLEKYIADALNIDDPN